MPSNQKLRRAAVELIQEDIDKGERRICGRCPMALALSRYCGEPVAVGFCFIWAKSAIWRVYTPVHITDWMENFDCGITVDPSTFFIDLPSEIVDAAEARLKIN